MPQFLLAKGDVDRGSGEARLRGEEAHHLLSVLRAEVGQRVSVFDGVGGRWCGRLAKIDVRSRDACVDDLRPLPSNESALEITLFQSIPKGERWEWVLQKGTELGVTRFVPVSSRRGVVRVPARNAPERLLRWHGIVVAAAKQCERGRVPSIDPPSDLREALAGCREPAKAEVRIVLAERWEGPAHEYAGAVRQVALAVGPEGGWTEGELAELRSSSFIPLRLGPRILRAETAALAAISVAQSRWGDLARRVAS